MTIDCVLPDGTPLIGMLRLHIDRYIYVVCDEDHVTLGQCYRAVRQDSALLCVSLYGINCFVEGDNLSFLELNIRESRVIRV